MRIGLTIKTFYPYSGGMQAHAERLIHKLQQRNYEVTIATRSISHTPSFQDFFFFSESVSKANINGLEVCVLRHPSALNGIMWVIFKLIGRPWTRQLGIQLVQQLFTPQLLKAFKGVDVIHHIGQAHELVGFAAAAAAKTLGIPFLIQPTLHPGQWGDSPLDLCLYKQADLLLVHTKYERDALRKLGITVLAEIVGNGVEDRQDGDGMGFRRTYGIEGPIILFLGRKTEDKGYPLVKRAFESVFAQCPDVTLVCMGPGGEEGEVDIPTRGIQNGLLELGFSAAQDKHDALAACTVLCVPSEGESFGLVYMEAARYGKPSVARRLPVLEELLETYKAGILVGTAYGAGNQIALQPEELATALLNLLNAPTLTATLGQNARQVSERFLWTNVVARFESAYTRAIGG
jgi:glycosyltransferase involved in cell wall biosynthesis